MTANAYKFGGGPLLCDACGRQISNDIDADNAAEWTRYEPRIPFCADSPDCKRDVYRSLEFR